MSEEVAIFPELNRDNLPPSSVNEKVIARLVVQTSDAFVAQHPRTNCSILLVLDASGSMAERLGQAAGGITKSEAVVRACREILPELDPSDQISVVFFGSQANFVDRNVPGHDHARLRRAFDQLTSWRGGMTNFEAALQRAHEWASASRAGSRRVLLLTDGLENAGTHSNAIAVLNQLARQGVVVDCLGIGENFAFDAMQEYSAPAGGRTERLETPDQAARIFRDLAGVAQRSLVHNVLLRLRVPAAHRDVELYQVTPEMRWVADLQRGPRGEIQHVLNLGSLPQHLSTTLLVAAGVDTARAGVLELCHYRLDYSIPSLGLASESIEGTVRVQVGGRELRDSGITQEHSEATLTRLEADFRHHYGGDWNAAARVLAVMVKRAEAAHLAEKVEVFQRYLDQLERDGSLSRDDLNILFRVNSRSTNNSGDRHESEIDPDDSRI